MFPERLSFSFTGYNAEDCEIFGTPWLEIYLLNNLGPSILSETQLVVSGPGIFAALAIILKIPVPQIEEKLFHLNSKAEKFGGVGNMSRYVRLAIEELMLFVSDRAVWLCGDAVVVSVTEFPTMRNLMFSKFFSKREMIDTFMASLNIPIYYETQIKLKQSNIHVVPINLPIFYDSELDQNASFSHISGSFSNQVPILSQYTMKVLPPPTAEKSQSKLSSLYPANEFTVSRFGAVKDSELLNVSIAGYNFMKDLTMHLVHDGKFSADVLKEPSKFKVNTESKEDFVIAQDNNAGIGEQITDGKSHRRWCIGAVVGKILYSPLKVFGF
ncbi:hypothetical protein HK098_003973 [Nowakowskiella sp. JEL0407]|nr:hypothetical protein HK098_003973 [Nowakowskiella sp. JEL0407]